MKNNGTFICEKKGLYLVIVTVMTCSVSNSKFDIYKNNNHFMQYYIRGGSTRNCYSGTGTAVVELNVNDDLNVRNSNNDVEIYENWSSFSAVKLK